MGFDDYKNSDRFGELFVNVNGLNRSSALLMNGIFSSSRARTLDEAYVQLGRDTQQQKPGSRFSPG